MIRQSVRRIGFIFSVAALVLSTGMLLRAQLPQAVGTWAPIGASPHDPIGAAAAALPDGRTLIAGGEVTGVATDAVVIFDPVDGSFTSAGQLVAARVGHTATALDDGRVLIAGGRVNGLLTADLEIFDPASGASTLAATMSGMRSGHAAARLANGSVLIAGGTNTDGVLQTAEIFDPATGAVTTTFSPLQAPRTGASATTLIDGRVLIAGGNNGIEDLASAEIYNPSSQSFEATDTNLDAPRSGHTAILLPHNNSVLIAGGSWNGIPQSTADLFLPAEFPDPYSYGMGQFAPTGPMAAPRSRAVGGPSVEGYAFVVGGGTSEAEAYRFATIKTDKDDYAPGQNAIITGSGWQPGEEVTLRFQEDPAVHDDYVLTVTADAEGNIYYDQWAPDQHDLNVRFYLMARDSRSRAQTTFTDAELVTAEMAGAVNEVTVAQGSTVPFTINLSATGSIKCVATPTNAATARVHTAFSISATGTLSSSTLSTPLNFYGGAPVGGPNCTVAWTGATTPYAVAASVSAAATTPAGDYVITLSTLAGTTAVTNPSGSGGNLEDGIATNIIVHVVSANVGTTTAINAPAITYGQNGTVTVTVTPSSGTATPTGNVVLTVDGGTAVTKALTGGSAIFTHLDVPELVTPSAGDHPLSASYAGATGFNASGPTAGVLTVDPTPVTATAGSGSGTYNGFAQSPSACVVSGTYTGDLTCANDPSSVGPAAGTFTIEPLVSGTGLDNFEITLVDGSYTIEKAPVTATAGSGAGTYNGELQSPDACEVTGAYIGDLTCANDPASVGPDVGTFTIEPLASGTGLSNYEITSVNGSYTIEQAPVTATAGSGSGTYNGFAQTPSDCQVSGTYTGDLTCANNPASVGPDVGSFTITPLVSGTGLGNYAITNVNGSYTISKAPVTATAGSGSGAFSGFGQSPSACAVTGLFTGDLTCANDPAAAGPAVGTHVITPVVSGTGLGNYDITLVNGSYTITAWHLTGFYQPVGVPNSLHGAPGAPLPLPTSETVWNTIKGGQTVPLKFEIFESMGGTERTSVSAVQQPFILTPFTCGGTQLEDPLEFTATGGTSLRYDSFEGQFIQNWQSPKGGGRCYRATMTAIDGSTISAFFKTK